MAILYSISRLQCFEQCRLQYKFRYIDKRRAVVEAVEAFMGSRVHETLQEFYEQVKRGAVLPREWLGRRFLDLWREKAHDGLRVAKPDKTVEHYLDLGRKCLEDYYDAHYPFDRTTVIDTERFIKFKVSSGGRVFDFCGVLDRLDRNTREDIWEIHDYKTSSVLPDQEEVDQDLQLALYHLAVLSERPEARKVKLVWHYLAFNRDIESRRDAEALAELQKKIVARIVELEACRDFPPAKGELCPWCGYQPVCPEFGREP